MSIKNSPSFKAANKLAEVDPNNTLRSVVPTTSQVGKTEVAALALIRKIEQQDPAIDLLVASVQDGTLGTAQNQSRLTFVQKALQSYRAILNSFEARLETLRNTPSKMAEASLTLSGAGTAIKFLPIPGVSLTAGATSTFSGKLADIRAKGRDLLDAAQTSDSLLQDTELDNVDQELTIREEKLELLLEIQKQLKDLTKQELESLGRCLDTEAKAISKKCLSDIKNTLTPSSNLLNEQTQTDLYVVDFNGVSYRVIIQVVDSPFSDFTKVYRRALAVREDGMVKCVTEIVATEDVEYFVDSLRRCLLVPPFTSAGPITVQKPTFFIPSSLLFVGSFQNQTDLLILHSLGTNDFIIQVYEDDGSSLKQIIPEFIKTLDNSRIEITLSQPTSGKVVFNKPTELDTNVDTTVADTSKIITHNLSVELPLVQVYSQNEILIPEVIEVIDDNTIRVQLSEPTDFRVVTFNPPAKNIKTITSTTTSIQHRFNTVPPLVQVYYSGTELVQIVPEEVQVVSPNIVQIKLSSLSEYRSIVAGASEIVEIEVLSCTLGIEVTEVP